MDVLMVEVIQTDEQYNRSLSQLSEWIELDDPDYDAGVDALTTLIGRYEAKHFPTPEINPIQSIRFRLDEMNWSQNDLARQIEVSSGRMSEYMTSQRSLTLGVIRSISGALNISPEILIQPYLLSKKGVRIPREASEQQSEDEDDQGLTSA